LVVANWTGGDRAAQEQKTQQKVQQATPARVASAPAAPSQSAIDACNKYAASETGSKDKTMEVVKDGAIGAVVGAAVGAAGGAIAGGGKGAGKGAAIGGVVGGAWMIEQHDSVVRLGHEAVIPAGHPLARLSTDLPDRRG